MWKEDLVIRGTPATQGLFLICDFSIILVGKLQNQKK